VFHVCPINNQKEKATANASSKGSCLQAESALGHVESRCKESDKVGDGVALLQGDGDLGDVDRGVGPHVDSPLVLGVAVAALAVSAADGARQHPGAVGQVVDVVDTKKAEADVLAGVVVVPVLLAARAGEGPELRVDARIFREHDVAVELEDTRRRTAKSLAVKGCVPDTGGAVLGVTEACRVNKTLLAGGVGAEERSETKGLDGLGTEQVNESVGIRVHIGQEAISAGAVAVGTSDKGADTGAAAGKSLARGSGVGV